jgi:predicted hydrocarbon binding protein
MRPNSCAVSGDESFFELVTSPIDLPADALVAFPRQSLLALRAAMRRDAGDASATWLQEGGYAAGGPVFAAFERWCAARNAGAPATSDLDAFREHAARFFRDSGWGEVSVTALDGVVAAIDAPDWAEAEGSGALPYPSCFYSAGLLADFFGRVADAPLAALEVECRSSGGDRCRFLVGSESVLTALYDQMAVGVDYATAVAAIAAGTGRG